MSAPGFAPWLRLLFPNLRGCLGVITAYFDETGTDTNSAVVGFGGLFGTDDVWSAFDAAWRAKLAAPLHGKPALRRFHMAHCMARVEEFRDYSDPESNAAIHDFRQIIIESGLWGYAIVVSKRDWTELIKPPLSHIVGDAEAFCFRDVVGRLVGFVDRHSQDADLALVFDNRPERTELNQHIYNQYQGLPRRTQLVGLSFLSNQKFPGLQGADMFAWETFNQACESLRLGELMGPRQHALQFHSCGRFEANWADRASVQRISDSALGVPQFGGEVRQ